MASESRRGGRGKPGRVLNNSVARPPTTSSALGLSSAFAFSHSLPLLVPARDVARQGWNSDKKILLVFHPRDIHAVNHVPLSMSGNIKFDFRWDESRPTPRDTLILRLHLQPLGLRCSLFLFIFFFFSRCTKSFV